MLLLDTHIWAWTLTLESRLSGAATAALAVSDAMMVSATSCFEIAQKTRLGKWPLMEPYAGQLERIAAMQGMSVAPLTAEIAVAAGLLDWSHRDPFDRMIAATALAMGADLVSADKAFDSLPDLRRIW